MLESLHEFTTSLPPLMRWFGVMVAGAIPFVESYVGSVLGIAAGITPPVAIAAAVVGNIASVLVLVLVVDAIRGRVVTEDEHTRPRRRRLRQVFDRYGVPGVSLLGQTILPSQVTSTALVSFGASRSTVLVWQAISITLWGVVFGVSAAVGFDLLSRR